jgi:ketosteroid isomerase-like protein
MGMQDNHMKDERVRRFVAALRRFEQDGDESLLELFAPEATATRLDARGDRSDVASFWKEYRAQFRDVSTTFVDAVEGAEQAALEWVSRATLTSGRPVEYRGVTVLDLDGSHVRAVRTYYDTAALLGGPEAAEAD